MPQQRCEINYATINKDVYIIMVNKDLQMIAILTSRLLALCSKRSFSSSRQELIRSLRFFSTIGLLICIRKHNLMLKRQRQLSVWPKRAQPLMHGERSRLPDVGYTHLDHNPMCFHKATGTGKICNWKWMIVYNYRVSNLNSPPHRSIHKKTIKHAAVCS